MHLPLLKTCVKATPVYISTQITCFVNNVLHMMMPHSYYKNIWLWFVSLEEVKNYKTLQSYKYFTAGWILEHRWKCFTDCCLIVGKVNHSYALTSSSLQPWVIIKSTGTVVCGHCTCMAGLGETCSHVGALLYWIEYQVRSYADISSTSKLNLWIELGLGDSQILPLSR